MVTLTILKNYVLFSHSFNYPNEQLNPLHKLVKDCIDRHAPLVKTKFLSPFAPWIKQLGIVEL